MISSGILGSPVIRRRGQVHAGRPAWCGQCLIRHNACQIRQFRTVGGGAMDRVAGPEQDGLSSLLRDVTVRSVVYCLSDFGAPWGFSVERSPVAKFHVLLHGTAALTVSGAPPVPLIAGDLVVLPHGDGHMITDQSGSPARELDAILAEHPVDETGRMSYGGDGSRTTLLCGGFELGPALPDELAELLPPVLAVDSSSGMVRWLEPLFALLEEETRAAAPGAAAIFAKLADVFVTQALRSYLGAAGSLAPPAGADPRITQLAQMLARRPA